MFEPNATSAQDSTVAATPMLQLPAFTPSDVAPWFQRVEAQFRLRNVSSSTKKADFVIGALPAEVFSIVSRWLAEKGTDAAKYEDLKAEVILQCEPSAEEKAQMVLDLLKMPLGDQRPSAALRQLRNLTTVMNTDGTTSSLDMTLVLWMLRLPPQIRNHINGFTRKTDMELSILADSVKGTAGLSLPAAYAAAAIPVRDEKSDEEDIHAAAAAAPRWPFGQKKRQRPYHQQQHSSNSRNTWCQYHAKFGRNARNCSYPCSFPKNMS